ncbi:MFS sugar transporter-like protein [Mollisia scopiformis]|uniref:MFS sugar transporter-like protein n=1 Tax=Mollisia scopiformis TaxID=149040 RepID=A0A194XPL1_MOLSC|nr:MFS sugar transporter-like protein [Mollisia scopiformis]KUJ21677.1 MFS sugar transporter-like protein [Mollisia scopiformis]
MDGLSLYEQKSLLIQRELDAMGMGKYQWYIWSLCGLGYFLDLLWAQAFGLIATPLQKELGFSGIDGQLGDIFTAFSSGLTAGAFVWGVLVDIIGRRWAFNGTVLITCIFGLSLGAPNTYNAVLVLTAFNGFGIGGNIPIDTTICLEFLPKNRRFLLALLSIFQPLGVIVCSGIAYGFIPKYSCDSELLSCHSSSLAPGAPCCTKSSNYGWRYLMFTLGGISLFVFIMRFVVFTFQESPKYLLSKGKDEQALRVLDNVAKTNGTQSRITMATFENLRESEGQRSSSDSSGTAMIREGNLVGSKRFVDAPMESIKTELKRVSILFSTATLARLTILVWIIYAFDYWGFSVAGSFLPTILARKNSSINVSISETYRDYIIIYTPGLVGVALGALLIQVPHVGRKYAMFTSSLLMAVSLFLFAAVNTQASNVGLNTMEYFFQSMFNAILYGWTPEAFPASVRGTASGVASFWGRLFSIFSPLIAAHLLEKSLNGPLYLAGAGVLVCCVAILGLPGKTMVGDDL